MVQGVEAIQSSYHTLASIIPFVVASIFAGVVTERTDDYVPPLLAPPIIGAIGAGLISTWSAATPEAQWVGYQIL